jgi:hypothetical protein
MAKDIKTLTLCLVLQAVFSLKPSYRTSYSDVDECILSALSCRIRTRDAGNTNGTVQRAYSDSCLRKCIA